jgi:hypothetical protein
MNSEMILNVFLRIDKDSRKEFYEQFRSLVGPNRPIAYFVGAINNITHIEMRATKSYGGLTAVLKVIVSHTRKQYLAMLRSDNNSHGNRSTTERIEYFHTLHMVFGVDEADNRQVRNFDQRLRSVIKDRSCTF